MKQLRIRSNVEFELILTNHRIIFILKMNDYAFALLVNHYRFSQEAEFGTVTFSVNTYDNTITITAAGMAFVVNKSEFIKKLKEIPKEFSVT